MPTYFQIDTPYIIAVFGFFALFLSLNYFQKKYKDPALGFSSLANLNAIQGKARGRWLRVPKLLNLLALTMFLCALIDPHYEKKHSLDILKKRNLGFGWYLMLDQSGSMSEKAGDGLLSKMDILKKIAVEFVESRPDDMIGLVAFARSAEVLNPMTLDHYSILASIRQLNSVTKPEEDGTAMAYAIYKTAHLIVYTEETVHSSKIFDMQGTFMIMITDGFQDPNPLDSGNYLRSIDLQDAVSYVKKQNIHLYIVNIGKEIALNKFVPHRRLLKELTESTGGMFYMMNDGGELNAIFEDINSREKMVWRESNRKIITVRQNNYYPYFISIGLLCMLLAKLFDHSWLRRIP